MIDYNLFNKLFYRDLATCASEENGRHNSSYIKTLDNDKIVKLEYKMNSHNYRSEEFDSPAEMLFLGCSQTFGYGLPIEFTWPKMLSDKLNRTYHNLALGGDSLQGQVVKAFKYFQEIGNPKIICAIFPLSRMEMPLIENRLKSKIVSEQQPYVKIQRISLEQQELIKFSKAPYEPEVVLPEEVALFYSFLFLQMLEQYCASNDIKFTWSFWDDRVIYQYLKTNMPEILKNHIFLDISGYRLVDDTVLGLHGNKLDCHPEFKDHIFYNYASDYEKGKNQGHWGIHTNQHIVESFIQYYEAHK